MSDSVLSLTVEEERVIPVLQTAAGSLDRARGEIVLDFSPLHRIDSGALRALEDLGRAADEKSVKIVLRGVNVEVYKVLKLVRLTRRFSFLH